MKKFYAEDRYNSYILLDIYNNINRISVKSDKIIGLEPNKTFYFGCYKKYKNCLL